MKTRHSQTQINTITAKKEQTKIFSKKREDIFCIASADKKINQMINFTAGKSESSEWILKTTWSEIYLVDDSSAIIKNVKKYKSGGEVIIGSSNNIYNS